MIAVKRQSDKAFARILERFREVPETSSIRPRHSLSCGIRLPPD